MAYIAKTEGAYSFLDIIPEFELSRSRWLWVFFHPNDKPKHEHVALHLRVSKQLDVSDFHQQGTYDTFHFGIDRAGQLMNESWAESGELDAIRFKKIEDKIYLIVENGEVGSESDGYGSFCSQRWYSFSKVEYQNMKDEFKSGMQKMEWKR